MKSLLLLSFSFILNFSFSQDWINDASFYVGSGSNSVTGIQKMIQLSDDKILIHGSFTTFNDTIVNRLTRLKSTGGIDTSFNCGSGPDSYIYSMVSLPNGKILISGDFLNYDGIICNRIARLNQNGSIDLTFNPGLGADAAIYHTILQPDGKIIICGSFSNYNGYSRNKIARLNEDGSIDLSFDPGIGANGTILRTLLQTDGKVIFCGNVTSFNTTGINNIARLNTDGSLDFSFYISSSSYQPISRILLQDDGKVLVFGAFTEFNGELKNNIVRLLQNGQLDNSFNSGTGVNNANSLQANLTQNGQIFIYGSFTSYNDTICNRIVLLNSNGSIDSTFNLGSGANDWVQAVINDSTNRIVIAGKFTTYNDETKNNLTRLVHCTSINVQFFETACNSYTWPINNQTLTISGLYSDTLQNFYGCDSIITLNLTIIPSQPLILENSFSLPSDANNCIGQAAITVSGNADFELNVDNGLQIVPTSGYNVLSNLCPGVHDLKITDNCGDTLHSPLVIPVDSNYVYNNPYLDSIAVDSLGATISNCTIYYNSIDTAYIDSIWSVGNVVNVIWNIVDATGSNYDTTTYNLNNGNGVYLLQLNVFCPTKSLGDYFTVTEAIYFANGSVYVTGIDEKELNHIAIQPNPTNDYVTITNANEDIKQIVIFDLYGKELQNEVQDGSNYSISLNDLPTGIYLFKIKTTKGEVTKRVVKQ